MTTPRQTAKGISDSIISQLEAKLNTTIPLFPKAFNRVLAKALGGIFVLLYQFAGFILLQYFVKTASNKPMTIGGIEVTPLKMWGELVDMSQKLGLATQRTVQISVLTQGGSLTSGTRIVNSVNGIVYVTLGDVALDASLVYATIEAVSVGVAGNVDDGTQLQFVSPPQAVQKVVYVSAPVQEGEDPESTEAFRDRIAGRFAARPQGGAYADYRDWAEAVDGVKQAYPYSGWGVSALPDTTSGQTFVFIESEADADGIPPGLTNGRPPGGALLTSVFEHIEADDAGLASRRNVNTYLRVFPIYRATFDIQIGGLLGVEDAAAARTAVEEGLTDYFLDRGPYITGLTVPPRKDIITKMAVGGVVGNIVAAYGGTISSVALEVSGSPVEIRYLQEGEKAKRGAVSWV